MPQVIYRGRWPTKRTPFGEFVRGIPQDVEQEWLDTNARRLVGDPDFVVIGNEAVVDESLPGDNPDEGWTRAQIYDWLTLRDIRARAGLTKPQLMKVVGDTLGLNNEEESEDSAEESMSESAVGGNMVGVDSNDEQQEEVID